MPSNHVLEGEGFVRLRQIVGDPKSDPPIPPIIPISVRSWWRGIAAGIYPKGIKIGPRVRAWEKSSIREVLARLNSEAA